MNGDPQPVDAYPEHSKLTHCGTTRCVLIEFLDWLRRQQVNLTRATNAEPLSVADTGALVFEFLGIDHNAIIAERQAMFAVLRDTATSA